MARRFASITVDTHAFQTGIGPTFAALRRDGEDYTKEKTYRIADVARVLAPRMEKEFDRRYYPGELADSIEVVEHGPKDFEIVAGAPWAGFQEFGTGKMRAQPYLRPAITIIEAESI
jgi:HK97 gp10 family phage protein